ncbi:MAG: CBS domain-containing protein [Vicinamibacterales bacterium]
MTRLRVRDLMSDHVMSVRPDSPLAEVRDLMIDRRIRHVPVVEDDGTLVGLVSERDLLRQVLAETEALPISARTDLYEAIRAREIMTRDVETIDVDEDISVAAQAMLENKYGCLPVVEEGTLAGILTEADFVRFLTEPEAEAAG